MKRIGTNVVMAATLLASTLPVFAEHGWRGSAAAEIRHYGSAPANFGQSDGGQYSLVVEPEYHVMWGDGRDSFTVRPFLRVDSLDSERTHFDVREMHWQRAAPRWELRVGISKVFWGVTESQHLVDIVNQTDLVESPDGEDKLGQPMIKYTTVHSWGIVDLFVLPGFRERTFPGVNGRLRPPVPINTDRALYESGAGAGHVDFAARWSHSAGPFDVGVSYFAGTSRDPRFVPALSPSAEPELVPFYEQIDQVGVDLQATVGSWLWKLEAIRRDGFEGSFLASTGGFEYTFWGVGGSAVDAGALVEYLWDERGVRATSPFADDLFVGSRLAFNDVQNTSILVGAIVDLDGSGRTILMEAARRLARNWVIEVELRAFAASAPRDPLAWLEADDHVQLSLQRHF
jgi:hypothetical protein